MNVLISNIFFCLVINDINKDEIINALSMSLANLINEGEALEDNEDYHDQVKLLISMIPFRKHIIYHQFSSAIVF